MCSVQFNTDKEVKEFSLKDFTLSTKYFFLLVWAYFNVRAPM